MHIVSNEDIFDLDGDCLYKDIIILSWKEIKDEAIQQFAEKLELHGFDLVEYNLGNSDFYFRIVFNKETFRLKNPMWSENY